MRSVGRVLAAIGGLTILGWMGGFAASLARSSGSLGATSVAVARCQTSALTITQTLSGANVTSVTVAGLSSACGGATLTAAVDNLTTSSSGSGTAPAGGGSMTVNLASTVAAKDVERIDVSILGP